MNKLIYIYVAFICRCQCDHDWVLAEPGNPSLAESGGRIEALTITGGLAMGGLGRWSKMK